MDSFGGRAGTETGPGSVPQVAAFAIVAVERTDHVGGSMHLGSVAAGDARPYNPQVPRQTTGTTKLIAEWRAKPFGSDGKLTDLLAS